MENSGTQTLKYLAVIFKSFFCVGLILFCMFAVSIILKGGATRLISVAGFFISAHTIQRYSTPAWCVNAPTALEVIDSGKGCTVLYYSPNLNNWDMSITEKQNNCATCAQKPITADEIINEFLLNDDVKNIKQTLTDLFHEWVQCECNYDQKVRSTVLFHYRALMDFMHQTETFVKERRAV